MPLTMVISYQLSVASDQLSVSSNVTLKVYDLLGLEVAVLVNEKKESGHYSVQWNASGVSSGIYYYRLTSRGFVDIKKMVVVKYVGMVLSPSPKHK